MNYSVAVIITLTLIYNILPMSVFAQGLPVIPDKKIQKQESITYDTIRIEELTKEESEAIKKYQENIQLDDNLFDEGLVLSDFDIIDYQSMTLSDIQHFLEYWKSGLRTYVEPNTYESAALIIFTAANNYHINPKYLLVLLQKEQSLIESTSPTQRALDWATGYGVCDSCSKNDPTLLKYKGFKNQIEYAAWRTRFYLNNRDQFYFQKGNSYIIDGIPVRITNEATRALYIYTPHIHGNLNFWKLWNRYFQTTYPDGTVLKTSDNPDVYLIEKGHKRKFNNYSVFVTRFKDSDIITSTQTEMNKYPSGPEIIFSPYTIAVDEYDTKYLILENEVRMIANDDVFASLGYNPEELQPVYKADMDAIAQGNPITNDSLYPLGALLKDASNAQVYYVENNKKHRIVSAEILKNRFRSMTVTVVASGELARIPEDEPILFRDGTLIKSSDSPIVYIVTNNTLREISDENAFLERGYQWNDVITTSTSIIELYTIDEQKLVSQTIWQ